MRLTSVNDEKNATPGAAARDAGDCLTDVQPVYVTMDRSARSQSDPATQRENAIIAYDTADLSVQTSAKFVDTWDSSYAWQAFPYSITRPASGGDFRPDKGRGRRHAESPVLLPTQFLKMLSRRSAAATQSDWTIVPALRGSTWTWQVEHISALAAPHFLRNGGATNTACRSLVEAAKNLVKHLQSGVVGSGPHRIPIKGDITLLPRAAGISNLEKPIARSMCWIFKHLPGTQAL